jgi:glutamate synthase (NADPH) large chain
MVDVERLTSIDDIELVRDLLIQHAGYTGSAVAKRLLNDWDHSAGQFVKVMPLDYRRVLEEQKMAARSDGAPELLQTVEVARG